jgi:hypothetical protein
MAAFVLPVSSLEYPACPQWRLEANRQLLALLLTAARYSVTGHVAPNHSTGQAPIVLESAPCVIC